jgi:hypothetical protein
LGLLSVTLGKAICRVFSSFYRVYLIHGKVLFSCSERAQLSSYLVVLFELQVLFSW